MSAFLTLLLLPLLALFLIMLAAIWTTNRMIERFVGQKHRRLEEIVNTGEVPGAWTSRFARQIERLGRNPQDAGRLRQVQDKARQRYLRNLEDLIRYTRTSPLVADDETRQVLLARLMSVRAEWSQRDAGERRVDGGSLFPRPRDEGGRGGDAATETIP